MSISQTPTPMTHEPRTARANAPRLVLGFGFGGVSAAIETHCQSEGWATEVVRNSEEAGRSPASVVVLCSGTTGESAVLTAAKLQLSQPATRVVIIGPEALRRHTEFAGATFLPRSAGVAEIVRVVLA